MNKPPIKPKIGLLGLMIELYERLGPELRQKQDRFARQLAASWKWADVLWPGVANTRQKVHQALRHFESESCDVIVVLCLTYAPSLIAARALLDTPLPVVLLDTQKDPGCGSEPSVDFLMQNHGVHGVQDLANVLLRGGRTVPIVVGHWRCEETTQALKDCCLAACGRNLLHHMRIGLVGRSMSGMGDLAIDETTFALAIGPEVVPVNTTKIADIIKNLSQNQVKTRIAENTRTFEIDQELSHAEHAAAVKFSLALEKIANDDGLDALAVYFLTVSDDGRLPTLPFLAASRLMADGLGYAGEGDIACAALVAVLQQLAGPASFTEMFAMDFEDGSVLMQHMGEANYTMCRTDRKPLLTKRHFPLAPTPFDPATPCFAFEPGPATLCSLSAASHGRFRIVIAEGEVLDWGPFPTLRTPHFKFKPTTGLNTAIETWSRIGGSHHQAICWGHRARLLSRLAGMLGIESIAV